MCRAAMYCRRGLFPRNKCCKAVAQRRRGVAVLMHPPTVRAHFCWVMMLPRVLTGVAQMGVVVGVFVAQHLMSVCIHQASRRMVGGVQV